MSPWEIVPLIPALAGLLGSLAPQRAIAPNEPGVVGLSAFQVQVSIRAQPKAWEW
ncbi:MAG: hypothetical protein ACR2II_03470 [Chthoniobacterales bacterium]